MPATSCCRDPLGILQPSPAAAEIVPDIVLVPLAAFDRTGHRIGYGAGHYDRTLAHLHKSKGFAAIGLAFSGQEVAAVPALQHDVPLGLCANGNETVRFPEYMSCAFFS